MYAKHKNIHIDVKVIILSRVSSLKQDLVQQTDEVLKAVRNAGFKNDNNISLYVKNYNLETLDIDGKVNPIASLIEQFRKTNDGTEYLMFVDYKGRELFKRFYSNFEF